MIFGERGNRKIQWAEIGLSLTILFVGSHKSHAGSNSVSRRKPRVELNSFKVSVRGYGEICADG